MSHHLLSPSGAPVTPPFGTRGQHCGYMEQLRRSVEQLRHQTACKSPSSSCSSTTSSELCRRSSFSRSSDTLYHSTSATPECLVVYEPHVVVNNISQVYPGYRSSSSSSSASSSPEVKLEDVSDIFEDSGVDLGFPKQLTPRTMYPQQHYQQHQQQHQHHQQQQQQYQYQKEKLEQLRQRQSAERLQHNENLQISPTNSNLRHQEHSCNHREPYEHTERQHRREAFSKDRGTVYDREPPYVLVESNMVDKSTHTHVSEFGGVCFCAVEVRKDKNMNNQSSRLQPEETPRSSRQSRQTNSAKSCSLDNSIECILEPRRQIIQTNTTKSRDNSLERILDSQRQTVQTNSGKSHSRDNSIEHILEPRSSRHEQSTNPQVISYRGTGSAEYRQSSMATQHNSPIRSTSAGSGTHKISLTSALIGAASQKGSRANTVSSRPTQKDNVYIDMSRNSVPLRQGTAENRSNALRHSEVNVDEASEDDDTPTATPTPEDDNVYVSRSYLTQSCQTVKSVLNKNSPRRGVVNHRGISVQAEVHGVTNSPDTETEVEYVKADSKYLPETDSGYSTGHNPHKKGGTMSENDVSTSDGIAHNGNPPHKLKRSPSVTSLISMTDTMSVTSLEVANIMAVSSKEEKKSAVKLEKERLQLQHQRLESYQHNYHDDTPSKSVWTEKGHKNYNDDSLKKHKIYQSVLENLPSSTKGPESDSNLHHFVTQSLQSFFTGGGKSLHQHQNQYHHHHHHHHQLQHQYQEGGWGEKSQGPKTQVPQGAAHLSDNAKASSCSYSSGYVSHSSSPKQSDLPVPLPSLFQLTACFRLFHVVYGDWTDLRNIRLYPTDILLEDNSRSPSASSRSPGLSSRSSGSPGSRSVASVLSGDSGAFRSVSKGSPAGRYTFLVISSLGNHRMELDTGGLQVGDHIIEVNDMCMLNRTPEVFYSTLRKLHQVHLVIGRRRCGLSANQMASCDSSML